MRILHVIPTVAPCYGGPSEAVRHMTSALARRGIEVHIATTTGSGEVELDVPVGIPVQEGDVIYHYFRRQAPKAWDFSWPLRQWLFAHIADYDLAHIHAVFSFPTLAACWAGRRSHVPYVLRPLGTLDSWPLGRGWWKKWPYLYALERANLRQASAIHATSEMERRELARLRFVPRARVIPLGVPRPLTLEPRDRRTDGGFALLFIGRLHPIKGLPLLLEALGGLDSILESIRLVIAGSGDSAFTEELRRLCARLGLESQVEFCGFVSGDRKRRLLEEANAFILPSYHENFGLSAAEAMGFGLPVIVSDQVGLAHDIEKEAAGIVTRCDVVSIRNAIVRLARNPTECQEMGRRGRAFVQEQLTWERVATRLIDLYEDIIRIPRNRVRLN